MNKSRYFTDFAGGLAGSYQAKQPLLNNSRGNNTAIPPFMKGALGGIGYCSTASAPTIPPNPPFSKGGV
ncbi:MAG TPA: hypothetical protein DDW45_01865 [Gammaproteobacteria bacterium]|nr:hypothetical protein [Gammaproteobacteria bacterium]